MRTAAGVVFFLLILFRGAVAGGSDPALQSDRPIRVVDRLSVNTSNTERYVVFRRCERQAVRDISTLLKQSNIEGIVAEHPDDFARSMERLAEALNTKNLRVVLSPFLEH